MQYHRLASLKKQKSMIYLIDAGHGGMVGGKYTTAPNKMYEHSMFTIYEGVYNRNVKKYLMEQLNEGGFKYVDVSSGNMDIPLDLRVDYANDIYAKYGDCLYISIHGNAGKGTGFEVWTSVGQTRSDKYADVLAEEIIREFPEAKFRTDKTDGDWDKESMFYVLKYTKMPAVLSENGFMDRLQDATLMRTPQFQRRVANAHYEFIKKAELLTI